VVRSAEFDQERADEIIASLRKDPTKGLNQLIWRAGTRKNKRRKDVGSFWSDLAPATQQQHMVVVGRWSMYPPAGQPVQGVEFVERSWP
jgi:hypothetical protein